MNVEHKVKDVEEEKVCAVVVTYNRKELLMKCLQGLLRQSTAVDAILIIDNASTDHTPELLLYEGYIQNLPPSEINEAHVIKGKKKVGSERSELTIVYVRMHENAGGAGGFHEGIKCGYRLGYNWLWLMDDDGIPDSKALKYLLNKKNAADLLNSLVLDVQNKNALCFSIYDKRTNTMINSRRQAESCAINGLIQNAANTFNGTFISKELVTRIGLPMKEMFIWGDEVEYLMRAQNSGLGVATVVESVHYHPKGRVETIAILNGKYRLNFQKSDFKNYCDMRNKAYTFSRFNKILFFQSLFAYTYLFTTRLMFKQYLKYLRATFDGVFCIWGREKSFLR